MRFLMFVIFSALTSLQVAVAEEVKFEFNGKCAQLCDAADLNSGDAVSGWLSIDSSWLPTIEGETLTVSNSHIADLAFNYGAQTFDYSGLVSQDSTLFTLLNGHFIISNGAGILTRNNDFSLLISGPSAGHTLPIAGLWLQESSTASWGTFAVGNVPEPSLAAMLVGGLICIAGINLFQRKRN